MKTPTKGKHKIRYAVVGLRHLAQVAVLPAFKSARNSELVALISDDPQKREKLGRKYGVERVYSYKEYETCLADGVDAVYLVLPNHLHRAYAIRAAKAGSIGRHTGCRKR
jgi:predicted dehydrogenase